MVDEPITVDRVEHLCTGFHGNGRTDTVTSIKCGQIGIVRKLNAVAIMIAQSLDLMNTLAVCRILEHMLVKSVTYAWHSFRVKIATILLQHFSTAVHDDNTAFYELSKSLRAG